MLGRIMRITGDIHKCEFVSGSSSTVTGSKLKTVNAISNNHSNSKSSVVSLQNPSTTNTIRNPFFLPSLPFQPLLDLSASLLLKTARETDQSLRQAMLHELLSQLPSSTGYSFFPYLKDALRLGAAHLLADTQDNPLVGLAMSGVLCGAMESVVGHGRQIS